MSLHGHEGVLFYVKAWSPKIDIDIFEEPENQRIFSTTLLFPILKVKFSVAETVKIFFNKKVFEITIFVDYSLIFKDGNSKVVENVFSETNKS